MQTLLQAINEFDKSLQPDSGSGSVGLRIWLSVGSRIETVTILTY